MINRIRAGIARLAALGAVKRRGVGALQAYGGTVQGKGHVIHKADGSRTDFVLDGEPGKRNSNNGVSA